MRDDGGFVISKVQVLQEPVRPAENVKYVRIELPRHDWLTMAEVQVFRGDENVARAGRRPNRAQLTKVSRSWRSTAAPIPIFPPVDRFHTRPLTTIPGGKWILVQPTRVDRIVIWNEEGHPNRLAGGRISLLDPERKPVWQQYTAVFTRPYSNVHDRRWIRLHKLPGPAPTASEKTFQHSTRLRTMMRKSHGWSPDPRRQRHACSGAWVRTADCG